MQTTQTQRRDRHRHRSHHSLLRRPQLFTRSSVNLAAHSCDVDALRKMLRRPNLCPPGSNHFFKKEKKKGPRLLFFGPGGFGFTDKLRHFHLTRNRIKKAEEGRRGTQRQAYTQTDNGSHRQAYTDRQRRGANAIGADARGNASQTPDTWHRLSGEAFTGIAGFIARVDERCRS